MNNTLMLIDGNAFVHRAFHAIPPLNAPDGKLVNAVYGFFSIFLSALASVHPKWVCVAFDEPGPTFRDTLYDAYKATRQKAPQSLYDQFPLIKHLLDAFAIPHIGCKGYEADDIIGTMCRIVKSEKYKNQNQNENSKIIIVTGDNDVFQLINDRVSVMTPSNGSLREPMLIDSEGVVKKYGFGPEFMVDYKALRGDASDNIPGVAGVGEKTATTLIQTYGHLDDIYAHCGDIAPAVATKLVNGKKEADLSLTLATIATDSPVTIDLESATLKDFDHPRVVKELEKLGFKSLIKRLPTSTRIKQNHTQPSLL